MGKLQAISMVEQHFGEAIEALSSRECQFNFRLFRKTKKVAALLNKLSQGFNLMDVVQSQTEKVREEFDCAET
jgi:hypothetical protein